MIQKAIESLNKHHLRMLSIDTNNPESETYENSHLER